MSEDRTKTDTNWTLRPSRDNGWELAWSTGERTQGWWLSADQVASLLEAAAKQTPEPPAHEVTTVTEREAMIAIVARMKDSAGRRQREEWCYVQYKDVLALEGALASVFRHTGRTDKETER